MAGVVVVDGTKFPRTDAGISAAIASLNGPGEVRLSAGVYQISNEIEVGKPGVHLIGMGYGTRLVGANPTGNMFHITAPLFVLEEVEIASTVPHSAGSIISIESDQGEIRHVRVAGSFFNGFTMITQKAGLWNFDDVRLVGDATWNYLFLLRSPANTIASTKLFHISVSNSMNWKTASIVLDTGVDTFICSDSELGPILVENSLHGQAPRWVRFTNVWTEGGNKAQNDNTDLQIDAVRDLLYIGGGMASATYAVKVGAAARGVDISHNEFVNVGRSAVTIAGGARDVSIVYNTFEDTGVERNGAFDTIAVADGAADFDISHNIFKSSQTNLPRYNLSLAGKCVTCVADGNRYGGFQVGAVSSPK
jgi:hypothetical protein